MIAGHAIGGIAEVSLPLLGRQVPRQTCTGLGDEVLGAEEMALQRRDVRLYRHGIQDTPVGAEGNVVNSVLMRDPDDSLPVVVSTTRAVPSHAPGREIPAVGAEGYGFNIVFVRDPDGLLAGRGLVDPGGVVRASGGQIPAVGAEDEGVNSALVRDTDKLLAGGGLDDPGGLVTAPGREIPAVGAEGYGSTSSSCVTRRSSLPVVVSTTRAVLPEPPVARYRPSGLKATA